VSGWSRSDRQRGSGESGGERPDAEGEREPSVGVTRFFRDEEVWDAVAARVLPAITRQKRPGDVIRIWVPGCSTGEEAYSFAIVLAEHLGEALGQYRIRIFATDTDRTALERARLGVFPERIAAEISAPRVERFFVRHDDAYEVSHRIRDLILFAGHDVTTDPPFSRLDLVSCRNLLIYLRPTMQKRVLRIVHYSLLPTGYLMLGSSETVGDLSDYFAIVDRKNKIYARRHVAETAGLEVGLGGNVAVPTQPVPSSTPHRTGTTLASLAERKILELYGPPGVLVNDDFDVIHIRGRTRGYLEPMPGAPSFNILRLSRPDLHVELRRVLTEARTNNRRASIDCRISEDANVRPITIEVIPVADPETKVRCFMVLFHEEKGAQQGVETGAQSLHEASDEPSSVTLSTAEDAKTQELERELVMTKEYLQSAIEELESSNEELKSSNEELQSSNEELQSTNEELETSKEELQSSNEELTTVNDELHSRMGELQLINDDLHNILSSMGSAMVIVGLDLRIRRFTQVAETLMNLVPGDVGRTVSLLNAFILGERIEKLAAQVIEKLVPIERRIACANQRWYVLHVTPYKTLDHAIKGAVIVLLDIDDTRRLAERTEEARRRS
jgi:two-component system CheB/CheR fusion protein